MEAATQSASTQHDAKADAAVTPGPARAVAPVTPNATTVAAIEEARRGELPHFATVQELFDDLHAPG